MPTFRIIEAKRHHCGQIVRIMRTEHLSAIARVGENPHRALVDTFSASAFRRSLLIDGRLAAVGGVHGMLASPFGFVWVALSQEATRYPVAIVRLAREQLDAIMNTHHELATTVIQGDTAAMRFAAALGFHVGHDGAGQRAYSRAGRRRLISFLETDPEIRVPIGSGFAMKLGFHPEDRD